jgi:ABC-type phosphate/phosphonate transport system substrate-binding protein
MLATLPMYDWLECRSAVDAFWTCLARHAGIRAELSHGYPHSQEWCRPDLAFSQTCGYPFTHQFRGRLGYIATPHYKADGCNGADYCSIIMAREARPLSGFAGSVAIVNSPDSMSGMLALKLVFAPFARSGEFFARSVSSGAHLESLRLLQTGAGDVCAIDAVCVGLARRYRPELLQGLVEVARSPSVPGLPFVTRTGNELAWRRALAAAFSDPESEPARQAMLMEGFSVLPDGAYDKILQLEDVMQAAGGLRL